MSPLSEVEWATKIKSTYLEALEEENYGDIPGAVYARGFLAPTRSTWALTPTR